MFSKRFKIFNGGNYLPSMSKKISSKFFTSLTQSNRIEFLSMCNFFREISESPLLNKKKEIFKNFLLDILNNSENKEECFQEFGDVIKLTIPYLNLIQNKIDFRDKGAPIEVNSRYQYTFDLLIKNYISEKFGVSQKTIQKNFIRSGDLSLYLMNLHKGTIEKSSKKEILTMRDVLDYKENIVLAIGNKSYQEKLEIFSELISRCTESIEIFYIGRIFLNKLKIGIAEKNVINCVLELEKQSILSGKELKYNYRELINYLEKNIFKYQIYYLSSLKPVRSKSMEEEDLNEVVDFETSLNPGNFVELQLGRPGMDIGQFISTISKSNIKFLLETKYDGERSQLHFNGDEISMGSRSLQDQSFYFQNIKNVILSQIKEYNKKARSNKKIKNFIIDGEIVSFNHKTKKFCNFQELRMKKNVSEETEAKPNKDIQYMFIAFDVLYFNDENVHKLPLEKRKELLNKHFYIGKKFTHLFVEHGRVYDLNNSSVDEIKSEIIEYFNYAKSINCEGLVGKELGRKSHYVFGKRRWYKLKTLNIAHSETLDLVPIAGFIGKGTKDSTFTSFLVAAYDRSTKSFIGVCKLGTGFDQKDLLDIRNRFTPNMLSDIPETYSIPRLFRPTVFFKPKEVWEIGFDAFSESRNYSIGKGIFHQEKGLSLRFPRFLRFRPDKNIESASSPEFIIELYKSNQNNKQN